MRRAVHGEDHKCIHNFEEKISLRRPRGRQGQIGGGREGDWIQLAQDRDQ
jgi:hypothetical protein